MRVLVYGMPSSGILGVSIYLTQMSLYIGENIVFDYVIEGKSCAFQTQIENLGGEIFYISEKRTSPIQNLIDNKQILYSHEHTHEAVYFNIGTLSWIEPIKIAVRCGYRVYVHSHMSHIVANDLLHNIIHRINKVRLSHMKINRLTCSDLARAFMFLPEDSVETIRNAIDLNKFIFNTNRRKRIRDTLGIEKDEKIIGFVGRLDIQKNPVFLVDILKDVIKRNDFNIKMLIIGEGSLKKQLKQKIDDFKLKEHFILLGNRHNICDYYQAMDVFVLPSLHEGLPIVAVEAQASGLQCVFSDRITEEANITGDNYYLTINDASKWAEIVSRLLENKNKNRTKIGLSMKNTRFDIEREAKRLAIILNH